MFRGVNTVLPSRWAKPRGAPDPVYDFPLVLVSGHGGGRWYNFHQESWHFHGPGYRHLLVDGTTEPLHLYQCNPEHARSEANLVDSPRFPGNGSPEHFAGEGVDPRRWHMLVEQSPDGATAATRPLDRPVLYRRGQPGSPSLEMTR